MIVSRWWTAAFALLGMIAAACTSAPVSKRKVRRSTTSPPPPMFQPAADHSFWIESGAPASGRVCEGIGWEWRRFEVKEKSSVAVDLAMDHDRSDVDLFLYDDRVVQVPPTEDVRAFSRSGVGTAEHIRQELTAGVYYLKVVCFGGGRSESVGYTLSVDVRAVAPLDEPQNHAYPVIESSKGSIGIGQRYRSRWYMPTFKERGTLIIDFRPRMERGELRFDVQTPSNAILATVTSATAPEMLRVPVSPGTYYFRLETTTADATGSYAFQFVVQQPKAPPPPTSPPPRKFTKKTVEPPPAPPVPVEAPRSAATPLRANGMVRVTLGDREPAAKWYSFETKDRSRVTIQCNCRGESVTLELYRRGTKKPIASDAGSLSVEVDAGSYEMRAKTNEQGTAGGQLKSEINVIERGVWEKKPKRSSKKQR